MMEEVLAYLVWAHGSAKALMVRAKDVRLAFRGKPIKGRRGGCILYVSIFLS
jgi:hypothetical protein